MAHAVDLVRPFAVVTDAPRPTAAATWTRGRAESRPEPGSVDIEAIAAGSHEAFASAYAAYGRMVRAILLGRVPRGEVDDLVQDVFLLAYTRIGELRDASAFGGWIASIARNRATDHLRRTRRHDELPAELPGGDGVDAGTLIVLDAIRRLPEAYRDTLLMRLVEGMTGAEIADRTGLSPGSVRVNLHRGMKRLREKLGWNANE